jgi:hypothetical protein
MGYATRVSGRHMAGGEGGSKWIGSGGGHHKEDVA